MKQFLMILTTLFFCFCAFGQVDRKHIADSISEEGKTLYRSEMASWYGTDVFVEKFKSERENIGGYFSYPEEDSYKCLFFSKGDNPEVLGTITFKDSYDPGKATIAGTKRSFTAKELNFYSIRKAALAEIEKDTSLFRTYKGTNLNLIPIIDGNEKKVYVLTGTSRSDVVIIGNDYLLHFDNDNKLISKRKLHANILSLPLKGEEKKDGKTNFGNVHNHIPETGDYITATDICTFMLYGRLSNWKQQLVISEKYMSIWNCETNKLIIVPIGN